jgi:hypothetical protein
MQGRTRRGCAVCGSHEIERDEVLDAGVLGLAQCVRCEHRWTERVSMLALAAGPESAEVEVAVAA